jgi:hypothetical protein
MRSHELCRIGSYVDSAELDVILDFRLGAAVRNSGWIVYSFGQIVYVFGTGFLVVFVTG